MKTRDVVSLLNAVSKDTKVVIQRRGLRSDGGGDLGTLAMACKPRAGAGWEQVEGRRVAPNQSPRGSHTTDGHVHPRQLGLFHISSLTRNQGDLARCDF